MGAGPSRRVEYEIIDHTADFGIRVCGSSAAQLFQKGALALADLVAEHDALRKGRVQSCRMRVAGADWPDLMVNWLREILYLWAGEEKLVQAVRVLSIGESEIVADVEYERYSPERHLLKNEIKAVTYHQIEVADTGGRWVARVIFDV